MKTFFNSCIILVSFCLSAQGNHIEIGLIIDNQTKLSKSFAFYELFEKNNIQKEDQKLIPNIVDFVYASDIGIEGTVFENNISLKLYKNGKKIKDIKCTNDWEIILKNILSEIQKFEDYKLTGKFQNISEGKQADFYSRKILDNLPGKLTIQIPENKIITLKSINANLVKFKSKEPAKEIKELIGKFSKADLNDIIIFKAPEVPETFKSSIKPLLYPISKTMTFSLKMLSYGGVFIERKENNMALNCFYTTLNTSKEILSSSKEKAIIRSLAFKNISDIYSVTNERQELSKLYALGADINLDFSNSTIAQKEFDEYYSSIAKVSELCQNVENQVAMSRNAIALRALSVVSSSLASNSATMGISGVDLSALTNSLSATSSQSAAMEQSSNAFFSELSQANDLIKSESFIIDGIDLKNENNYLSNEILYYLVANPLEIKNTLMQFSTDKSKLKKLLLDFYNSKDKDRSKLIQDIYIQFSKIEIVITGLETRGKVVEDNYKSNF